MECQIGGKVQFDAQDVRVVFQQVFLGIMQGAGFDTDRMQLIDVAVKKKMVHPRYHGDVDTDH